MKPYTDLSKVAPMTRSGKFGMLCVVLLLAITPGCQEDAKPPRTDVITELKAFAGKIIYDERDPDHSVIGLELWDTAVDDSVLERIGMLKDLHSLTLIAPAVTDAGVKAIKDLRALRSLEIHSERITTVGVGHLQGLTNLVSLDLEVVPDVVEIENGGSSGPGGVAWTAFHHERRNRHEKKVHETRVVLARLPGRSGERRRLGGNGRFSWCWTRRNW